MRHDLNTVRGRLVRGTELGPSDRQRTAVKANMDENVERTANPANAAVWTGPRDLEPSWFDYNGHLNMAYYHVLFDRAVDAGLDALDLGEAYRKRVNASVFNVETHVVYRAEVREGDRLDTEFRLLSFDAKRLHAAQRMVRAADGLTVATSESLFVHVDLEARRAAAFAQDALARVSAMAERHGAEPWPEFAGRAIARLTPPQ